MSGQEMDFFRHLLPNGGGMQTEANGAEVAPKGIRRWRQESPDRRNGKSKEWARAGVTASSSTAGRQDQGLLRSSPQRTWTTIRK